MGSLPTPLHSVQVLLSSALRVQQPWLLLHCFCYVACMFPQADVQACMKGQRPSWDSAEQAQYHCRRAFGGFLNPLTEYHFRQRLSAPIHRNLRCLSARTVHGISWFFHFPTDRVSAEVFPYQRKD